MTNNPITIALCLDYDAPLPNMHRDGIGVYIKLLFEAMLDYNKNINLEMFFYDFNRENIIKTFDSILKKYPQRIKLYDNNYKKFIFNKHSIKKNIYKLLHKIFKSNKAFINKYNKYKLKEIGLFSQKKENNLIKILKKHTKADYAYSSFCSLKLMHNFEKVKIMQVHDLMFHVLKKYVMESNQNYEEISSTIMQNLSEYTKTNTFFVTGTSYIANEQILKEINGAKKEFVKVIPYPPMLKDYDKTNLLSKQEVLEKFKIPSDYIFYASANRPQKNLIQLLKAIKNYKEKYCRFNDTKSTLSLVTTGKINSLQNTENFVNEENIQDLIIETGTVTEKELYSLYKHASMVVVPTIMEGPGIAQQALEAIAIGVPVIHTRAYGVEDALNQAGLNIKNSDLNWVDIGDYETMAQKIFEVINNREANINKQKHIIEPFLRRRWSDVAKAYIDTFEQYERIKNAQKIIQ